MAVETTGRHKQTWLALSVLAAACLLCAWPLLLHPTWLLVGTPNGGHNDLGDWFVPHRMVPRVTLGDHGQLPFWCPWWGGGTPHLGNPQSSVLYPLSWPFWVVDSASTVSWSLVLHHLIAGVGAWLLCGRLGCGGPGALVGGLAFGLSPVLLARTCAGHLPSLGAVAWFPWSLAGYLGLRAGSRRAACGLAAALALAALAGHLQEAFFAGLCLGLLCLADALREAVGNRTPGRAARLVGRFGLAALGAAGLMAAELIPMFVYVGQSATAARSRAGPVGTIGLPNLLQLFHPFALGLPTNYTGPGWFYWETLTHFGLAALGLAVLGLVTAPALNRRAGWLAWLAIGTFVMAFGQNVPVLGAVVSRVPGLAQFRCPGRWLMLTALPVAVLAAFGVDAVGRLGAASPVDRRGFRRAGVVLLAVVLGAAAVGILATSTNSSAARIGRELQPEVDWPSLGRYPVPWLSAVVACGAIWTAAACPRLARRCALVLVAAVVAESTAFSLAVLAARTPSSYPRPNPALRWIEQQNRDGERVLAGQNAITDYEAIAGRILKIQQYEPVPLNRPLLYLDAAVGEEAAFGQLLGYGSLDLSDVHKPLLDLWGVRYLVLTEEDRPPRGSAGWQRVARMMVPADTDPALVATRSFACQILENLNVMPRGFVVGGVRVLPPDASSAEKRHALAILNPREDVLLAADVLPPGPRQSYTPARRTLDSPNHIVLEVETQAPGYLVLSDSWYPGWRATVDGRPEAVLNADVAFRAVPLRGAGKHTVEFRYAPVGFVPGLTATGCTLIGLLILAFGPWRLARPSSARPSSARPSSARPSSARPSATGAAHQISS